MKKDAQIAMEKACAEYVAKLRSAPTFTPAMETLLESASLSFKAGFVDGLEYARFTTGYVANADPNDFDFRVTGDQE